MEYRAVLASMFSPVQRLVGQLQGFGYVAAVQRPKRATDAAANLDLVVAQVNGGAECRQRAFGYQLCLWQRFAVGH